MTLRSDVAGGGPPARSTGGHVMNNQPKPAAAGSENSAKGESVMDRRGPDRRSKDVGSPTGLERRRGPGRRLSDFTKAAEEGEMTQEQFMFLVAIDEFKKANDKVFPTWTDVLEVIRLLGYRKTMPSEIRLPRAEDWREPADAPAQVRPDRKNDHDRRAA